MQDKEDRDMKKRALKVDYCKDGGRESKVSMKGGNPDAAILFFVKTNLHFKHSHTQRVRTFKGD